jgi:hypothetical protein
VNFSWPPLIRHTIHNCCHLDFCQRARMKYLGRL